LSDEEREKNLEELIDTVEFMMQQIHSPSMRAEAMVHLEEFKWRSGWYCIELVRRHNNGEVIPDEDKVDIIKRTLAAAEAAGDIQRTDE